jgi:uncharacterized protein YacL (UPF0231 family)|tara:strand:- start:694 stop:996 length:303 start_codon:yes stop_codon:yes gene_type:complete
MIIKYLKLVTGEELVTEWIEDKHDSVEVKLKNPLGILMSQTEKGFNIQLVPYGSMADKEEIMVNYKNIVFHAEPEQKLRNQYESITGQVITPPTPKIATV